VLGFDCLAGENSMGYGDLGLVASGEFELPRAGTILRTSGWAV